MLHDIWCALGKFFDAAVIKDYLFPIASGIYLTFITARVIRFRDTMRALENELDRITRSLDDLSFRRQADTHLLCMQTASALLADLSTVASELEYQGHKSAHDMSVNVINDVRGVVHNAMQDDGPDPSMSERDNALAAQHPGFHFYSRASSSLRAAKPRHASRLNAIHGSLFAYLSVRGIDRFLNAIEAFCMRHSNPPPLSCTEDRGSKRSVI